MIVLQIIGGFVLILIVLALLGYLYFRLKFGKFLDVDTNQEPLTISLNEDISPEWLSNKKVTALIHELEVLGYKVGSTYSIYEMDDIYLQSFFNGPFTAVVYWHEILGKCWVDIVIDEVSEKEYTFSNAPMGGGMDNRPESHKLFRPTASVNELQVFAEQVVKKADGKFVEINEDNFRGYFESAYKKDTAWKARKGGMTFEEFSKTEQEASFSTSKKNIEEAFIQTKLGELEQWHDAAIEDYRLSKNINEEDFDEYEYKLIIVPFTSYSKAFLQYLEEKCFLNEKQLKKFAKVYSKETNMQTLFENINKMLSPKLRAKEVGEHSFPLELKIYQLSDEMFR